MAAVSEQIVREYFESHGFLVRQPHKYQVAGKKRREEEIDLLALNPNSTGKEKPESMLWCGADLRNISSAIISVRGWHTEKFSPSVLKSAPGLFRFAENAVVTYGERMLGCGPAAKILCVPDLPVTAALRKESLEMLKAAGIDGVLTFRVMLFELIQYVEKHKSYEKSSLLQTLRILKIHGLLQNPQLELWTGKGRRRKSR